MVKCPPFQLDPRVQSKAGDLQLSMHEIKAIRPLAAEAIEVIGGRWPRILKMPRL